MKRQVFTLLAVLSILLLTSTTILAYNGDMGLGTEPLTDGSVDYPYLIEDLADFDEFASDSNYWSSVIRLAANIDLIGRAYTTAVIAPDVNSAAAGFQGIAFTGVFDGSGHTISNLTIDTAGADNSYLGLFGKAEGINAEIKNLRLENISITAGDNSESIGGLCAEIYEAAINNCYVESTIIAGSGSRILGGLCGSNYYGNINNCYVKCTIEGYNFIGGLSGNNYLGSITNCFALSSVTGTINLGGLCGSSHGSDIVNCYVVGEVTGGAGSGPIGGLCGRNNFLIVSSAQHPSGLIYQGNIINCYSMSTVTAGNNSGPVGGLCGSNSSNIVNSYSTGTVSAGSNSSYIGGLCGHSYGSITASFWDVETSGIGVPGGNNYGATGKTTEQLLTKSTFTNAGWDFAETWWINDERNYPKLYYQPFADLNYDGIVNFYDFAIMSKAWFTTDGDANYNRICELSGDNQIDEADLAVMADLWLQGPLFIEN